MQVYLVGPITGQTYSGATEWRNTFSDALRAHGMRPLSPMRGKDYLLNETNVKDAYEEFPLSSEQGIFNRDLYDVRHSDALVCNFLGAERVSIGSIAEIAVAYENKRFIIVVMEPTNIHNHSFVRRFASVVVDSLHEALITLAILKGD